LSGLRIDSAVHILIATFDDKSPLPPKERCVPIQMTRRRTSLALAITPVLALTLAASVASAGTASPAWASASAAASRLRYVTICRPIGSMIVHGRNDSAYLLRNDNFARRAECIRNRNRWSNFAVTRSAADSFGPESQAYPELQLGCAWNACTPHSGLPRRVDRLRHPVTTWHISASTSGRWNAGYDIWFSRREHTSGQDRGAEIMIWLNTSFGRPAPQSANVVWIRGFRYYFEHWVTHNALTGASWNLVIFRRYNATNHVDRLRLLPFLHRAERARLLRPRWWLSSVDAGFEIWHGGRGLATKYYWAHI